MRFKMFTNVFLILIFFSCTNLGIINLTFASAQSEKELLLELRNNLTFDSSLSTKLVTWNESINYCRWNGVKCDDKSRVSGLDLSGESITGGINDSASSLFRLVYLQSLSLAQNTFDSTELPSGFGKLAGLRYLNLSNSGFSGQVPLEFSSLTRLVVLDLSSTFLKLENPDLGRLIHSFTKLRELYLDGVNISANGHDWCNVVSSSLPNLSVLSLSNSYLLGPFDPSLLKLRSLSVIRLDGNTFSSNFPEFLADFKDLRVLTLSSCNLSGVVPDKLFQIRSLEIVDLSNNRDLEGSLPEFPLNGSIQNMLLSYTKFSGNLSESIGNLRMLSNLDLRACRFSRTIPGSIKNLSHLVYLDLSLNQFTGNLPSFALLKNVTVINLRGNRLTGQIYAPLFEGLENLNFLDLSENWLQGEIPGSLFALPLLKVLSLSNNSFRGSIFGPTTSSSYALESLDLSINSLEGPIPKFMFELQNVSSLSLASNKFNGSVDLTDLRKLTNLVNLDLSYNNLFVHVNEKVPVSSLFPRLGSLMLASCKMQKLPLLKNQTSLMMLDLSDNRLEGEIPSWMWQVGNGFLRFLNLSHNHFTYLQEPYDLRSLNYLDLNSNMLTGQIPLPLPSAVFIDFSSNNFSSFLPPNIGNFLTPALSFSIANNKIIGSIPSSLCNATRLQILDLSNNGFNGKIPSCLLQNRALTVLNVRRNNLSGDIPDTFPVGCGLETLDLSWNVLEGKVPKSLTRCTEMEVLNLGNNELNDTFPCWLKNLPKLRVLVLRFNKFHGNISCLGNGSSWPNLQMINIASNNLNGVIPADLFRNVTALMVDEDSMKTQLDQLHFVSQSANGVYYQDSVTVTLKGQDLELDKILTIFTSIDFSNNHLHGTIPQTIGELKSLYVLNFSHNALSGHIPSSIGNLQKLESLDLSFNELGGKIPKQIADLTFLSFLNLSYNHLVGRIPQGSQMQTFPESSFIGNEGLCGFPLINKTCSETGAPPPLSEAGAEAEAEERSSDTEIYVSAALGFVVGLGILFGPVVFCKRWRTCCDKIVSRLILLVLNVQDHRQLENEDW